MAATGIGVIGPDDLARAVDAGRNGAVGGQGVVEDGVGVDWHLVSFRESVDRKAEPFSNSLGLNCSRRRASATIRQRRLIAVLSISTRRVGRLSSTRPQ